MNECSDEIEKCMSEVREALAGRWMTLATLNDWTDRRYTEEVLVGACRLMIQRGEALMERDHKGHVVLVSIGLRVEVSASDRDSEGPCPRRQPRMKRSAKVGEIVSYLREHPRSSVAQMADALDMDNSSISAAIVRLQNRSKVTFMRMEGENYRRYSLVEGAVFQRRAGKLPILFAKCSGRGAHAG